ncbi:MAG TPA: endo-1,4-beta-xylanase [Jatrophihabitantaceae bacterium]
MRLRYAVAATASVVTALAASAVAGAVTLGASHSGPPQDSLRALAAPVGLRIGSAIDPSKLSNDTYEQIAANQFSTVTPENQMKWQVVEPTQGTYDWSGGDQLVAFARAHGQLVRGHTLVWHNQLPDWLTTGVANGTISDAQLKDLLHKHITDEVTHFKGKIWQWDVANEMFANSWDPHSLTDGINADDFWVSHLGEDIIADAFRWAHQADPNALLFYNDFNISGQDGTNAKSDAVYNWVKTLRAQGVPIDGVGEQGHLDTQYGWNATLFRQDLQRYAGLGVKVAVTEADVRTFVDSAATQNPTSNLATFAQPYEYKQMLQACMAVPQCISFTVWGFGDAYSWVPSSFPGEGYADLYDVNLKPKQVFADFQEDLQLAQHGAPHRLTYTHQ